MSSLLNNILKIMKVWRPQFENFIWNIHTHFHLDGFVNRQNCRVWENPRVISEKQMHPQMRILARRHHRTILFWEWGWSSRNCYGARYRDTITQFFLIERYWCSFNETMKRFNYCTRHFLILYSLVSVIRIGPLDRVI